MLEQCNHSNDICAIIVTYNGKDEILNTVNSLVNQVAHILIIDNGSGIDTIASLQRLESGSTRVIYNAENTGVAHALNQGVIYAQEHHYHWVLTMDQDSVAGPDMVRKMLDCANDLDCQGNVVSFSPVILSRESTHKADHNSQYVERYTVITSGNLLKMSIFDAIGLFDEKLFIDSVDFEYCLRIRKHGYKIVRCLSAALFHSLGTADHIKILNKQILFTLHPPFRKYFIMRNHIYITKTYLFAFPIYCLWKQVAIVRLILQMIFYEKNKLSSFKYMLKGLYDGIVNNYQNHMVFSNKQ